MNRKHSYDPEAEAKKNYLAYQRSELYAKTDIPLHPTGGLNCLTPEEIWEDFNPYSEPLETTFAGETRYTFTAKRFDDYALRVEIDVYKPAVPSKRAVLLVQEYGKEYQPE